MNDLSMINRRYKDTLFKFIFGNPENKEWTLSLYNAMNHSNYSDPDKITFTTIENAVYMNMNNDVSFLVSDDMNLYEQQSTFNPNMPMRFLIYSGMVYANYIETESSYHRFSSKLQHAPTPKCVCFYNGTIDKQDKIVLELRSAFGSDDPDINVRVTMLNINYGCNKELLEACKPLKDYSFFVSKVREHEKATGSIDRAVELAILDLESDSLIRRFLLKNKAEVKRMCITEYDEVRTFSEQREEGRAEGRAEGIAEGRAEGRSEGIAEGRSEGKNEERLRISQRMKQQGFSDEQIKAVLG